MWFTGRHVWNLAKPRETTHSIVENTRKTRLEKLREKAEALNLTLEEDEDGNLTRISGNVPKTSQRTSIEQIVKYDCPNVVCEMTDDETLARAVKELVWGLTEGRLKLVELKDRTAKLMGMTNSEEEWNTIVDNIRHDVPRLAKVESDVVYADVMAAKLREALSKTGFHDVRIEILPGELQFVGFAPKESSQTFVKLVEEAVKYFPENARLSNLVKWKESNMVVDGEDPVAPKVRQLPITGIVVHPYPCVILADGQRLGKGSLVGGYTIDDISLTEVSLSREDEKLTWRP
jgi:type III secretion system YscD/HrpQ family protein